MSSRVWAVECSFEPEAGGRSSGRSETLRSWAWAESRTQTGMGALGPAARMELPEPLDKKQKSWGNVSCSSSERWRGPAPNRQTGKAMITRKILKGTQREKHTSCCVIHHFVDFTLMTIFLLVKVELPQSFLVSGCQSERGVIYLFSTGKNLDILPELSNMFLSVWITIIFPPLSIRPGHCGEC